MNSTSTSTSTSTFTGTLLALIVFFIIMPIASCMACVCVSGASHRLNSTESFKANEEFPIPQKIMDLDHLLCLENNRPFGEIIQTKGMVYSKDKNWVRIVPVNDTCDSPALLCNIKNKHEQYIPSVKSEHAQITVIGTMRQSGFPILDECFIK